MKKIYITLLAFILCLNTSAQVKPQNLKAFDCSKEINFFEENHVKAEKRVTITPSQNIVWESDFSNPNDWVLDNNGQNPPNYGWSIDQNSDGWWSPNGITSTSGGNFAELSNGDPMQTPGTQAGAVVYTMTMSQPVNIFDSIGSGNATLSFEEYGAKFYDLQEIQVSVDGINFATVGDNSTYSQLTQSGGSAYPNPSLREINLASYIGSTPTSVWIRFSWTSDLNLATTDPNYYNTWIAYGWYIDDVKIVESPANRVTMEDVVIGGFWIDYLNYSGAGLNDIYGLDYSVTPLSQLQNRPYSIEALFRNQGTVSQTVDLNYSIVGTGNVTSSNSVVLNPGDSAFLGASFSPSTVGSFPIEIYGNVDSLGAGIILSQTVYATKNIEITDYIYGKDLGPTNSSSYILGGLEDQNHITSRFEMYADEELYSLRAYIADNSTVGAEVKAIIYEVDSTVSNANGGAILIAESDDYTITAQDRGAWVDIPFVDPVNLSNGYAYEFGIVGYQHPSLESYIGLSGSSMYNGEHSLFDELGLSSSSAGSPTWYYIVSTPMVRMNFDPSSVITSVVDKLSDKLLIYPNPSNGLINIELDKLNFYNISISNVLAKEVYNSTISAVNTTLDLSNFDKGLYFVELNDGENIFTKKLIIE
ncbi:T9SS type A sorting domain-containing protein [Flavobacteriales bacterium]|nr:T9SS type A sorting domain-containing protein [Flavobacteriales bacterium]